LTACGSSGINSCGSARIILQSSEENSTLHGKNSASLRKKSAFSQEKFSTSLEKISIQSGKIQHFSGKNQHSVRKNSALLWKKSAFSQENIGLHNRHRTHVSQILTCYLSNKIVPGP
jgi:hypothetical protein